MGGHLKTGAVRGVQQQDMGMQIHCPAGRGLSGMTCLPVVGQTLEAPLEKQEQGQGL